MSATPPSSSTRTTPTPTPPPQIDRCQITLIALNCLTLLALTAITLSAMPPISSLAIIYPYICALSIPTYALTAIATHLLAQIVGFAWFEQKETEISTLKTEQQQKVQELQGNISSLKTKLQNLKDESVAQITKLNENITQKENQISSLKTAHQEEIQELNGNISSLKTKLQNLKDESDAQIAKLNENITQKETEISSLISQHQQEIENQVAITNKEIAAQAARYAIKFGLEQLKHEKDVEFLTRIKGEEVLPLIQQLQEALPDNGDTALTLEELEKYVSAMGTSLKTVRGEYGKEKKSRLKVDAALMKEIASLNALAKKLNVKGHTQFPTTPAEFINQAIPKIMALLNEIHETQSQEPEINNSPRISFPPQTPKSSTPKSRTRKTSTPGSSTRRK